MLTSDISAHFVDVLAAFYGQPKHPDELAMVLVSKAPAGLASTELEACAHHLLETRKGKTWPEPRELFAALQWRPPTNPPPRREPYGSTVEVNRERERDEAEARALRLLRNSPLPAQAVAGRWAPALIEFVTQHGREPSPEEEHHLIAVSRRNDASVATEPGKIGEQLRALRRTMHQTAASRLGLAAPPAKQQTNAAQPLGAIAASQRAAEQNLERLKAETQNPDLARQLAAKSLKNGG